MTTRLTLILVAALASAPVVFAPNGLRAHLSPFAGWTVEHDEVTRIETPVAHSGADCVVIGSSLLQPYRAASSASGMSNRPTGLASGGSVACASRVASGS